MSLEKKPIPDVDQLEKLAPPDYERRYFDSQQLQRALATDAADFDSFSAWWLAEASYLAFADDSPGTDSFVSRQFAAAGFPRVRLFDAQETDTQCYVAESDEAIVVAFRGTEVINLRDWKTDVEFLLKQGLNDGLLHSGFADAMQSVWRDGSQGCGLATYLGQLLGDGSRQVWFTGHSLGGALATLAANEFRNTFSGKKPALYTYGCPRAGSQEFKASFALKESTYRFVNHVDLVPRVPPEGLFGYTHVGRLKYIDGAGEIVDSATNPQETLHLVLWDIFRGGFSRRPFDFILDHAPVRYTNKIWNFYCDAW